MDYYDEALAAIEREVRKLRERHEAKQHPASGSAPCAALTAAPAKPVTVADVLATHTFGLKI